MWGDKSQLLTFELNSVMLMLGSENLYLLILRKLYLFLFTTTEGYSFLREWIIKRMNV